MEQNNLNCPICTNIMILPRIYDCGHTLCEDCMVQIDNEDNIISESSREAVIYKCPICRKTTHKPWFNRPKNLFLMNVLDSNVEYQQIMKNRKIDNDPLDNIPDNINLSFLCTRNKELKFNELYNYILPLLIKSCLEGKHVLTITDRSEELYTYSSKISKKLFDTHGIYKISSKPNFFKIYITKEEESNSFRSMQEFINNNYNSNIHFYDEDTEDEEILYSNSIDRNDSIYDYNQTDISIHSENSNLNRDSLDNSNYNSNFD
jgi:hypothetical protein